MPRVPRVDVADAVYHVINRRCGKATIFSKKKDYVAFEALLEDIALTQGMRILAYCLMPNHWHLVLQPTYDGHMGKVLHWLTTTHARRWHENRKSVGQGALYQGRYKSFPVETNEYLLQLIRYVERNPLRAKLVLKVEDWQFSSAHRRVNGNTTWLGDAIVPLPKQYLAWLQEGEDENIDIIRNSIARGVPFGDDSWVFDTIEKHGLHSCLNNRGRPKKY